MAKFLLPAQHNGEASDVAEVIDKWQLFPVTYLNCRHRQSRHEKKI